MDHFADVKTLRGRAAFCRVLAGVARNEQERNDYLHAAEMYEATVVQVEALAKLDANRR